mmetsp:Transcript_55988/g.167661  ORF Transcript_55988/g.167661 Transcript_55988/m.167661 type:complete len:265 (-) Transcript_55988:473-1267(-)
MPQADQGRKRGPEGDDAANEQSKRFKQTVHTAVAIEFTCPITNELPLDPAFAEDGRTYERSAIEEYFRRQGEACRSPVTNERMGTKLIPALQIRNMLENLIKDGAIDGDDAAQWKKRIKDERRVTALKKKAKNGNTDAMNVLAVIYEEGRCGIRENASTAFHWYEKASESKHFGAMASLAMMHIQGRGTKKNRSEGIALLGEAEQGGSSFAAFCLGKFYAKELHGLVKNAKQARFYLEKVEWGGDIGKAIWHQRKELLENLTLS